MMTHNQQLKPTVFIPTSMDVMKRGVVMEVGGVIRGTSCLDHRNNELDLITSNGRVA